MCAFPVPALRNEVAPKDLTHIIITHLGPNRFPTLKAVLEEALKGRPAGSPLKLVVTNPAKAALQKGLAGEDHVSIAKLGSHSRVKVVTAAKHSTWHLS